MSHARLGPSNHRWPNCPGSIREEEQYVDVAGEAAIDGTGSHLLLELCMEDRVEANHFLGKVIGVNHHDKQGGWSVDKERCVRVQMCLDYIKRRKTELSEQFPGCVIDVEAEQKADPGGAFGITDWWGTVDVTIIVTVNDALVFLEVCDYKDGRGWVGEKDNSQLQAYLAGQLRPWVGSGPDNVRPFRTGGISCRMSIVQPKTNPCVRYQDVTAEAAMEAASSLAVAAVATNKKDAPLVPGKHCQWCKANQKRGGHCTAAASDSVEALKKMDLLSTDSNLLTIDVNELTNEQLEQISDQEPTLQASFDRVNAEIEKRLEAGQTVNGYQMGEGRVSYVWNQDEEKMAKAFKGRRMTQDDFAPRKMISVAQMRKSEKLTDSQKKKLEADFASTKAGKRSLKRVAKSTDKDTKAMFDVPAISFL